MAIEPTEVERVILADVAARTGLLFRRLGGIGFQNESNAALILSVLADWPPKLVDNPSHRQAVLSVFSTPYAKRHLSQLIEWARTEPTLLGKDILVGAIEINFSAEHSRDIWDLAVTLPARVGRFRLFAKLAEVPEWRERASRYVLQQLQNEDLTRSDLTQISAIHDSAIRSWLLANGSRLGIDHVVRKLNQVKMEVPSPLRREHSEPDLTTEDFSTEVDIDQLPSILRELGADRSLKLPLALLKGSTYEMLDKESWVVTPELQGPTGAYSIWLNLEDETTARVVVLKTA